MTQTLQLPDHCSLSDKIPNQSIYTDCLLFVILVCNNTIRESSKYVIKKTLSAWMQ